jgi:H+/Cl- antiporter ClcA
MTAEPSSSEAQEQAPDVELGILLHSRGYLLLLVIAGVLGIPLSLIAFGFLAAVHELEHLVWETIPENLGYDGPPAWWPIAAIGSAGVLVGLAVKHMPGHGGHVPAMGFEGGATPPSALPGIILAAAASLVLGAVVGPEAPLIAMGGGLAVLAVSWTPIRDDVTATKLITATGSAAAISAIFGNPLVAVVMLLEVLGLARRQTMLVVLPCLISSGVGALMFTGLGDWTGLEIGALAIPDLQSDGLVAADLVWALPLSAAVAVGIWGVFVIGRKTAGLARSQTMTVTVGVGLVAGCSAAVYAVVTDHSPTDVALSGQATLATLGQRPEEWSAGALMLLLLCKGLAYAVCIGAFRGGPVFPAVFLGAAAGVLAGTWVPGIGLVAGLGIGMAAGAAAATRLPVTSILLVVLLLGDAAVDLMPVIILAAVTALVVDEMLSTRPAKPGVAQTSSATD